MNRRDFLRTAGGATAVTAGGGAATAPAAAQGGGKTVTVGPGGSLKFDPETVYVKKGGTVTWKWDSDNHNIVPDQQPSGANWKGHEQIENSGFTYEHTFDTKGEYSYYCQPHRSAGMTGKVVVNDTGKKPGGGGGGEKDPEEMGVPIRAHYVGIAAVLSVIVTLVFTFFQLKYGESPHASGGND